MDPNHLITAGLILLGFAVIFGLRHIARHRRDQAQPTKKPDPEG